MVRLLSDKMDFKTKIATGGKKRTFYNDKNVHPLGRHNYYEHIHT